jgi:hypothetical protein
MAQSLFRPRTNHSFHVSRDSPFEVPPDCYCTSVNTTQSTASLIQDFMECAETTPTFLLDRYQYYAQCGGSGMFIPDPTFFHPGSRIPDPNCLHPGSRILISEFKYFNPRKKQKNGFQALKNMIRVVHPGSLDPGSGC